LDANNVPFLADGRLPIIEEFHTNSGFVHIIFIYVFCDEKITVIRYVTNPKKISDPDPNPNEVSCRISNPDPIKNFLYKT